MVRQVRVRDRGKGTCCRYHTHTRYVGVQHVCLIIRTCMQVIHPLKHEPYFLVNAQSASTRTIATLQLQQRINAHPRKFSSLLCHLVVITEICTREFPFFAHFHMIIKEFLANSHILSTVKRALLHFPVELKYIQFSNPYALRLCEFVCVYCVYAHMQKMQISFSSL